MLYLILNPANYKNTKLYFFLFQEGRTTSPSLAGSVVQKFLDVPELVNPSYLPSSRQLLLPLHTKTEVYSVHVLSTEVYSVHVLSTEVYSVHVLSTILFDSNSNFLIPIYVQPNMVYDIGLQRNGD